MHLFVEFGAPELSAPSPPPFLSIGISDIDLAVSDAPENRQLHRIKGVFIGMGALELFAVVPVVSGLHGLAQAYNAASMLSVLDSPPLLSS
jgi:hypothetical protein